MGGGVETESNSEEHHERRKVRRRKKRRHRPLAPDVSAREKIYLLITLVITGGALIGLIGWGFWTLARMFLNAYTG